jgi:hypothetical protein
MIAAACLSTYGIAHAKFLGLRIATRRLLGPLGGNMTFIHSEPVGGPVELKAHNALFEIQIYRVRETGELRAFVSKNGIGLGPINSVPGDVAADAARQGADIVEQLIAGTVDDIKRNEDNRYS